MSAIIEARSDTAKEEREWELRRDMAAVFRVAAREGWNEQIGNHNSLMLPDEKEPRFLINPRGYLFQELKASDLIVCDLDGKVLRGTGELRKVAFHIHARIHLLNPNAACVVHVHPRWLTALSLLRDAEMHLSHHNNLALNDRIARCLGDKSTMVMRGHGVTVVGPTVADAFDECFIAERTAMYQMTAMSTGQALHHLPDRLRRRFNGPWGDRYDARLHLNAWRRILDREEPDYAL